MFTPPQHTGTQFVTQPPSLSVIIGTIEAGDSLLRAVRSVLQCCSPCTEIMIADQSKGARAAETLSPVLSDPRVRCIPFRTLNKGRALNHLMTMAHGEIVAFTDDDCEVDADWLEGHLRAFREFPRAAVSYGRVYAGPHDPSAGYVPEHLPRTTRLIEGLREPVRGIGANMAARREVILSLGGFDAELSPGGHFHSSEDRDLGIRAHLNGYCTVQVPDSAVCHHGFRNWHDGKSHTWRDWVGIGACSAKLLRSGGARMIPMVLSDLFHHAIKPFLISTLRQRPHPGGRRIAAFCFGLTAGWSAPIDRRARVFAMAQESDHKTALSHAKGRA